MNDIIEKDAQLAAWPKGISAITLFVEDLEAAREFYQTVFGLPVFYAGDTSTVFKIGHAGAGLRDRRSDRHQSGR